VAAGEPIVELHYNDDRRLSEAIRLVESALAIEAAPPPGRALILDHVTS